MPSIDAANARAVLEKWILATGMPLICDLERSQGAYLYDASRNIEYLDFFGFFGSRPLGFNHRGLLQRPFLERLQRAALHKPSNCDVYTVEFARFTDAFCSVALGGAFPHVFFIDGGGPAVDNAVKAAVDWKVRKNLGASRGQKGTQILHFKQAFHGRTGYALSLTDPYDIRKTQYFPMFNWPRVSNPKMQFPFDAAALRSVEEREAQSLKEIAHAFDANAHDIAAVIIEPIQGEGGDNYFRSEFLRQLRQICNAHEALLIFDEVQTGFGATGKWWDYQHHGVQPDILVFGKKTQICGFAATARMDEVDSVFKIASRISSTFEGNIVDMVRCERVIEIIEEEKLIDNAATMGAYLLRVLQDLAQEHRNMTAVRGRGLWAAFDMPSHEARNRLLKCCFDAELLVLACGERSIRLRPALDITADSIGRAAAQLDAALAKTGTQ